MQRLAKGEHISLGRRIGRVAGNGLEGQQAGDEKDVSRSPLGHIGVIAESSRKSTLSGFEELDAGIS